MKFRRISRLRYTSVAQLAELAALNREVVGSSPTGGTMSDPDKYASGRVTQMVREDIRTG